MDKQKYFMAFLCQINDIDPSDPKAGEQLDKILKTKDKTYMQAALDKFNNEVTFINPSKNIKSDVYNTNYFSEENVLREDSPENSFIIQLIMAEHAYFTLLKQGWKPEAARDVLPNATKTEIMMTGFIDDWKHFFDLRCSNAAHPQMRELACGLKEEFIKRNYINGN